MSEKIPSKDVLSEALDTIVRKLERLEDKIAEMEQSHAASTKQQNEILERTSTVLYHLIMEKMAPKTLERMLPALDESWISDDYSLSGYGRSMAASWLRNSASRVMLNMALFCCARPLSERKKWMSLAMDLVSKEDREWLWAKNLQFLRSCGYYDWQKMLPECEHFERCDFGWAARLKQAWATCIAVQGDAGNSDVVKRLLKQYDKHYGISALEPFADACVYANRYGMSTERIRFMGLLVEEGLTNRENNVLHNTIQGKRVAVVGSSPDELNKRGGKEIDAYDIVVRINHFPFLEYKEDYGSKTDVLAFTWAGDYLRRPPPGLQLLWLPYGFSLAGFTPEQITVLMDLRARYSVPVYANRLSDVYELTPEDEYTRYSTGLVTLLLLKKACPELTRGDIFGFSHKYPVSNMYTHFFNARTTHSPINYYHSAELEKECFERLFPIA